MNMLGSKSKTPLFGDVYPDDDQDITIQKLSAESRRTLWAEARLLIRDLAFAVMFVSLVMVFVVQPVKVDGTSMLPRLHNDERIFVNKLIYYKVSPPEQGGWSQSQGITGMISHGAKKVLYPIWPRLERGDVIVFWYPNDPDKSYVKRIVGLPNETVEVRNGKVIVNGQELNETYIDPQYNSQTHGQSLAPTLVKDHYYFVMGDNRDNSSDSRSWGLVPEKYIYGKALFRYWPLSSIGTISHDTDDRFVQPASAANPQNPTETPGMKIE
jgi:signal peptidase I